MYHDFSGMSLARRRLLIDWRHGDAIGYFESYQLVPGVGLYLDGMLEVVGDNEELARQVATEMAKGVPHEASIETDRFPAVEEVGEFSTGRVNGLTVRGPCAIVRKWVLHGVAVCPYGSDSATQSVLAGAGA
ncbi:hypothetical protein [Botrimarina mediterranea]|uniref:hypothetical protein n=1 Tax=Botrimarina mediterranea TaxID=2528022 RepID=UPI0011A113D8